VVSFRVGEGLFWSNRRFSGVIGKPRVPDKCFGLLAAGRRCLTGLLISVTEMQKVDDVALTRALRFRSFPGQEDSNL
jgi:hypothetical protein